MVLCKYFQQGSCRFGQYCRYEHVNPINTYGTNANRNKPLDGKSIALIVAEDVLAAERGGQWLLSCFGPFKEQPSIPGMEDVSPEEIRWEMYQAEKKGTVNQIKMQFQQLCQDMKTKRDALKNPTPEIITMLESLQKTGSETTFRASVPPKQSSFSFTTPQLGSAIASSTSSVFGGKSFTTAGNPFSGNLNSTGNTSLFGSSLNDSGPIFGSKSTFGATPAFGSTPNSTSIFGGGVKVTTPAFGNQNTQTFNNLSSQTPSVFAGNSTSQPVFGQAVTFSTTQNNNSFLRSETSLFGNSNKANSFGQSIFSQGKTNTGFPAAPVFGGSATFGTTPSASTFVAQSTFGSAPVTTNNSLFGSPNSNTSSVFGSTQNSATFGTSVTLAGGIFGVNQTQAFGSTTTTTTTSSGVNSSSSAPFGQSAGAVNSPFSQTTTTASPPFGQTTTVASSLFNQTTPIVSSSFGQTTNGASLHLNTMTTPFSQSTTFGQNVTKSESVTAFGNNSLGAFPTTAFSTQTTASTLGSQINFGSLINSSFTTTNPSTKTTTTAMNLFTNTAQVTNLNFGNSTENQNKLFGPFGISGFGNLEPVIEDNSTYTPEGSLTDDEKRCYMSDKFTLGRIPLKPPTKELR